MLRMGSESASPRRVRPNDLLLVACTYPATKLLQTAVVGGLAELPLLLDTQLISGGVLSSLFVVASCPTWPAQFSCRGLEAFSRPSNSFLSAHSYGTLQCRRVGILVLHKGCQATSLLPEIQITDS